MRILILSPSAPYPPNSGGRIRQWELIKHLGQRHDITAVYFAFTKEEYETRRSIEDHCTRAIPVRHSNFLEQTAVQTLPWPVRTFRTTEMLKVLEEIESSNFDAAIIGFIFMSHYRDMLPPCTVLQEHNIESEIFKQYASLPNVSEVDILGLRKSRAFWKATWLFMTEYENKIWSSFPLRITVSERDRQSMDSRCRHGETLVIENGVNTDTIALLPLSKSRKIIFMGTMDYYPNTDATLYLVSSIMPLIWEKDPGITLCIAGLHPPECIRKLSSDPRVEVVANPDSMVEVAAQCRLSVVPLRLGGGTRIKILEAMAMGLPVVSSGIGCEGLPLRDGRHILIRDDVSSFAEAVLEVMSDNILADNLRTNGRRLVEERYHWGMIFKVLEHELLQLVEKKSMQGELH